MPFNIENFKARLSGGGARPALFDVTVTNPINPAGDEKLKFTCKGAQIPDAPIGAFAVSYGGRDIKLAGESEFAAWAVTIINDEDYLVRNALEEWKHSMNTHQGNIRANGATSNPSSYKSDAVITHYSKEGQIIKQYKFIGLFPSTVAAMEMSWETKNTIQDYGVTFEYDYWTSNTTDSFAAPVAA